MGVFLSVQHDQVDLPACPPPPGAVRKEEIFPACRTQGGCDNIPRRESGFPDLKAVGHRKIQHPTSLLRTGAEKLAAVMPAGKGFEDRHIDLIAAGADRRPDEREQILPA